MSKVRSSTDRPPSATFDDRAGYTQWLIDNFGQSLVSLWPGGDPPGASVYEDVVGGHDATIHGSPTLGDTPACWDAADATKTEGGGSSGESVGDAGDVDAMDVGPSDSFSIIIWIDDVPPTDGDNEALFLKRPSAGWALVLIDFNSEYQPRFSLDDGTDNIQENGTTSVDESTFDQQPRLFGGILDRSSDEAAVYFDRESSASDASSIGDISNAGPVEVFQGEDHVYRAAYAAFFDRALSDDEMKRIYNRGVI